MASLLNNVIDSFKGEFSFLSNFYNPCPVEYDGVIYPTSEHAYQSAKTWDKNERETVRMADTPGKAKRLGAKVTLRADWTTETRLRVMGTILRTKFGSGPLRAALAATGDATLIEGNFHHDLFWGECYCPQHISQGGLNHLGRLLEEIRAEIAP